MTKPILTLQGLIDHIWMIQKLEEWIYRHVGLTQSLFIEHVKDMLGRHSRYQVSYPITLKELMQVLTHAWKQINQIDT